ncbi:energy transducer TonB [Chitinophaga lutea]
MYYPPANRVIRALLALPVLLAFFLAANAQVAPAPAGSAPETAEFNRALDSLKADVLPKFRFGRLSTYFQREFVLPYIPLRNDTLVTVHVEFTITREGLIENVVIKNPGFRQLDKEVARIFTQMPPWIPGYQDYKAVDVRLSIPLNVSLPNTMRKPNDVATPKPSSQPAFRGGPKALAYFIRKNMRYPSEARKAGIGGTVTVEFVVMFNGLTANPATVGDVIGYGLEEEAVRIVEKMPKWEPATLDGKPITTRHRVEIRFDPPR